MSLPVSAQKTGVTDPSLSIAVDAEGMLHFHNKQVVPQVFSETVKEEDEGTPLVDLVINRVEELDSNLLIRLVEQGRVLLNGKPAEAETQLKAGHQIELDVPATELLRRRVEQEIERGGLESGNISLLIQADKDVRHEPSSTCAPWLANWGWGRCCWQRARRIFTAARAEKRPSDGRVSDNIDPRTVCPVVRLFLPWWFSLARSCWRGGGAGRCPKGGSTLRPDWD